MVKVKLTFKLIDYTSKGVFGKLSDKASSRQQRAMVKKISWILMMSPTWTLEALDDGREVSSIVEDYQKFDETNGQVLMAYLCWLDNYQFLQKRSTDQNANDDGLSIMSQLQKVFLSEEDRLQLIKGTRQASLAKMPSSKKITRVRPDSLRGMAVKIGSLETTPTEDEQRQRLKKRIDASFKKIKGRINGPGVPGEDLYGQLWRALSSENAEKETYEFVKRTTEEILHPEVDSALLDKYIDNITKPIEQLITALQSIEDNKYMDVVPYTQFELVRRLYPLVHEAEKFIK